MNTVLIADDNKSWAESLGERLAQDDAYRVEAICSDGQDALIQIEALRPDIIILDIVMPKCDGVHIAKQVRTTMPGYHPVLYVLSCIGTDSVLHAFNALNVDFFCMKPASFEVILDNLKIVVNADALRMDGEGRAKIPAPFSHNVRETVLQLGLTPNRPSTLYVTAALNMCLENPGNYGLLTKVLYPGIAREYGTSTASVERNIRSAIAQMVKKNTPQYQKIFSYIIPGKITNNEFLSRITDYIRNG